MSVYHTTQGNNLLNIFLCLFISHGCQNSLKPHTFSPLLVIFFTCNIPRFIFSAINDKKKSYQSGEIIDYQNNNNNKRIPLW